MTDRLRIAFVVHDYNRYIGHSRYVVELASRYRHAHDVHVFTNTVDDPDTAGVTFHHIPAWRPNALASILTFIMPGSVGIRGTFDVVHAQGLCGLRHNLATAHICQAAWNAAMVREGLSLSFRQRVTRRLVTGLERRALCQAATRKVIAISELVRRDIVAHYGRTDGVVVIPHGTDTDRFHPDNRERFRRPLRAELGLPRAAFAALYVGDLKKGAAAAISATARTPGATLLVVSGSDTAPYRSLAEREGAKDRVIFLPRTRDVERAFAAADALLYPTLYDAFGLVITEAMASGLPVVTSRAAGAAELITHGADGLLTDRAWDVAAIATHLAQLRDDHRLRDRLGAAARARVEPFTWDRTADETLAVYRAVAADR